MADIGCRCEKDDYSAICCTCGGMTFDWSDRRDVYQFEVSAGDLSWESKGGHFHHPRCFEEAGLE
jgi:hypothetical protein